MDFLKPGTRGRSVRRGSTQYGVGGAFALVWLRTLGIALLLLVLEPVQPAGAIDLDHFRLVFEDDFAGLSISPTGEGTRWMAHTPWGGDFGDAQFADPAPDHPFTRSATGLRIELRRGADGRWQSGLLASSGKDGQGFSSQYGYFEVRAKLPSGPGVWPAFWLDSLSVPSLDDPSVEIDVMEHYGKFPAAYNSTLTVWPKTDRTAKRSQMSIHDVAKGTLSEAFHTYGVDVEPDWTVFYFDGAENWRLRTPSEHRHPLIILIDLGLGGGWPIEAVPNPSFMYVDYVRVYQRLAAISR